jgi:hypothetical protein
MPLDAPSKQPGTPAWRRILWLELWLCLVPPVGLWMLWRDPSFGSKTKVRIVFYTVLIPMLVYIAILVQAFNAAQRAVGNY